jgi:hypothetical protein
MKFLSLSSFIKTFLIFFLAGSASATFDPKFYIPEAPESVQPPTLFWTTTQVKLSLKTIQTNKERRRVLQN